MDGNDIAYSEHLEFMSSGTDDLLESLVQKEYFLEFQPITFLSPLHIVGFEALLRLSSIKGPIDAKNFVPLAERNGSMDPIGFWALGEAVQISQKLFRIYGSKQPFISVNLSGLQLELENFPEKFLRFVDHFFVDSEKIVFEIEQKVFLSKRKHIVNNIRFLRRRGHPIHLDEFDPKSIPRNEKLFFELIDAVKWPLKNYFWGANDPSHDQFFKETLERLSQEKKDIIFHKIDHKNLYDDLCIECANYMGQGYILGSPMGLETSLKVFNRYQ